MTTKVDPAGSATSTSPTRRPTVDRLEVLLGQRIDVLDHGFVRLIDYMGDDAAIVQAARVSYGTGTRTPSEDSKLIEYLMRHSHTSPFEMCEIKLHVKLPIFVARQWVRHRTASMNEYSARYSILDREFYVPRVEDVSAQSASNKQGRAERLSEEDARRVQELMAADSVDAFDRYQWFLNEDEDGNPIDRTRAGIARELARINLPLSTYTQFYWKIDLHNLLRFLRLRSDEHAQVEIRAYANAIRGIVAEWVPMTHSAFVEHQLGSLELSASAVGIVRRMLAGEKVSQTSSGIGKREWKELMQSLGRSAADDNIA